MIIRTAIVAGIFALTGSVAIPPAATEAAAIEKSAEAAPHKPAYGQREPRPRPSPDRDFG